MAELNLDLLIEDAMRLHEKPINELYSTLGLQLVAGNLPTGAAGIMSYLSAFQGAYKAKEGYHAWPWPPALSEWMNGLEIIHEGLKRQGIRFLIEHKEGLRKGLIRKQAFLIANGINHKILQSIVPAVRESLTLPREFEPVAATVTVIIFKLGLRGFFSQFNNPQPFSQIIELREHAVDKRRSIGGAKD